MMVVQRVKATIQKHRKEYVPKVKYGKKPSCSPAYLYSKTAVSHLLIRQTKFWILQAQEIIHGTAHFLQIHLIIYKQFLHAPVKSGSILFWGFFEGFLFF